MFDIWCLPHNQTCNYVIDVLCLFCTIQVSVTLSAAARNLRNTSAFSIPLYLQAFNSGETNQWNTQIFFQAPTKRPAARIPLKFSNPYLLLSPICVFLLILFLCSKLSCVGRIVCSIEGSVLYWIGPQIDVVWNGCSRIEYISELKCQILITCSTIAIRSNLYKK